MSLAKRVIPTILVRGRNAYKGRQFDAWRSVGLAAQVASVHAKRGVDELCVLDIAATAEGRGPDLDLVRELSEGCFVPITVGGGVKTLKDIDALLRAGADKVAIGDASLSCHGLLNRAADRFGSQAIVAVMNYSAKAGLVAFPGADGFARRRRPVRWASYLRAQGVGEILLQSMERDGMMQGYDLDLIRAVSGAVDVPVIASCGAGTYEHLHEALEAGADAVAAGAMFAFTDQTPRGAARFLKTKGWEVRV